MKKIGLICGISWESTAIYYQIINGIIKQKLGGFHSAKALLYSVDFAEVEECLTSGNWAKNIELISAAARDLEKACADYIIICTNTLPHYITSKIS